jgi:hypothetical protein
LLAALGVEIIPVLALFLFTKLDLGLIVLIPRTLFLGRLFVALLRLRGGCK